jgi:hypothetical protein
MWIDINKNNILRKEEKEMENKKLVVKGTEMEVVDGKVVISSEELAAAIQTQQIDLGAEEEANIDINIRGVLKKLKYKKVYRFAVKNLL